MDLQKLSAPFPESAVHWRIQGKPFERDGKHKAMALAYIDARDVMDRLDESVSPENWQVEYSETATGRVLCRIGILIDGKWVWKSDGAGSTAVEGEKGGISDALKRAAVAWGIGRYLYRLDSPWVPCSINSKGYWKDWIVSPWTLVNSGNYQEPPVPPITEAQFVKLTALIEKKGADETKLCGFLNVKQLAEMPANRFDEIVGILNKRADAKQEGGE